MTTDALALRRKFISVLTGGIEYELRDDFNTAVAPPLPATVAADPGPGEMVKAADTEDKGSISGGSLLLTPRAAPGFNDPAYFWQNVDSAGFDRVAGKAFFFRYQTADGEQGLFGLWPTTTINTTPERGFQVKTANNWSINTATGALIIGAFTGGDSHDYAIIMRDTFYFMLVKGSLFPDWTLLWVGDNGQNAGTADPVFPAINNSDGSPSLDTVREADLTANGRSVWGDDFGIATQRQAGARSAGDTFTHEADFLAEFTVTTLPAAGQIEFEFRKQDDNNLWRVTVDSTGALDLDEVVAGVPTQRGTAAAVITAGETVTVIAVDETISVFDSTNRRINYTSAANFKTETAGELQTEGTGGAVDDIVTWPRTSPFFSFDGFFTGA